MVKSCAVGVFKAGTSLKAIVVPSLLKRFLEDTRGNFSIITALLLLPAVMIGGMGVDYARTTVIRERVAIVAAETARAGVSGPPTATVEERVLAGKQRFEQLAAFYRLSSPDLALEQKYRSAGLDVIADVLVRTRLSLYFGRFFGQTDREIVVSYSESNHAEVQQDLLMRCHAATAEELAQLDCKRLSSDTQ